LREISTLSSGPSTKIRSVSKQAAKGHTLLRSVDNPNEIFVRVEFATAEEAKSFREKLRDSDVLQNMTVKFPPTVAEVADQAAY
jgi:hypothetical protein